jgi:hypothetical protein
VYETKDRGRAFAIDNGHPGFRHEALFYADEAEFLDGTLDFIGQGLARDECVAVVVQAQKVDALRQALGRDAAHVRFADMEDVGTNPARIIPAWRDLLSRYGRGDQGFRGIGEAIWATRSEDEMTECQRHESLLNLAFAHSQPWRLLCPYDVNALDHEHHR